MYTFLMKNTVPVYKVLLHRWPDLPPPGMTPFHWWFGGGTFKGTKGQSKIWAPKARIEGTEAPKARIEGTEARRRRGQRDRAKIQHRSIDVFWRGPSKILAPKRFQGTKRDEYFYWVEMSCCEWYKKWVIWLHDPFIVPNLWLVDTK